MGGKTKQRTKNNVRPSSSGRSALLLNNVKLDTGVMNIAGTELPALFPTLAAPNIDPLVSPELQLCIKKLNKKDPITKTKALQELSDLVPNSKVDDVVAALPSWTHFYKILTADPDRKVREATQWCHWRIVSACGRRLAPHLRHVMCAWLQAQYDEHAPARTHAQLSLHKTFPDSKLPEVISFCKNEVVTQLVDNLISTDESPYIRKTESAEEVAAQRARAATCSLHGVQCVARHLPGHHDAWLWTALQPLLRAPRGWRHAHSDDARVRAAWYAMMGRLIERYKSQFAEQYGQKTLRILIGAKESNPLATAQLWDCVLLFIDNVQEWHQYLDKTELFNKRILELLETGGWGDARHLSNIMLPLLAHLPETMLTKNFYSSFFDAIFNGLEKKTILSSKSERQSWITSLDECLRYISMQQQDYVVEIVTSVHRTWLERVLSDTHEGQIRTNLIKYSANSMVTLIKYWLKQAKECQSDRFDQLIRNFWQNIGSTIATQIDKLSSDHTEIGKLIDGHILLLQTLKASFIQEAKKQQSIKFDGDSPSVIENSPKETPQCDASIVERYNHNLNDLVEKICGHYFVFANKQQISSPVMTPLITLLVEFDGKGLYTSIARQFDCDSTYKFYDKVLRNWLAGDTMRSKAVVDIVFLFMKHLTEPEQDALFNSFKQFPPSVVEWCISLSLSHPHCLSPSVVRWMRGGLVQTTLFSICNRIIEIGDSNARNLLLMCLNHDADGEMIINREAMERSVEQVAAALRHVDAPAFDLVAALGSRLASTLRGGGGGAAGGGALRHLALELFRLTALLHCGDPRLSVETWREVRASWQDGMHALALEPGGRGPEDRRDLLRDASAILQQHLHLGEDSVDLKQIEHIVSLCPYLLSYDSSEDVLASTVDFTRRMFDIPPTDPTRVETFVLRHDIVKGNINCPFDDNDVTNCIIDDCANVTADEMTKENLIAYLNNSVYRAIYLRTILLHRVDEELEDTLCNELLADDYFVKEFDKVMYDFCIVRSMFDAYAFWPHYNLIQEIKIKMGRLIEDIISECTPTTKTRLLNSLKKSAATKGYYWSFASGLFAAILHPHDKSMLPNQTCEYKELSEKEADIQNKEKSLGDETQNEEVRGEKELCKNVTETQKGSENDQENLRTSCMESFEMDCLNLDNMKDVVTENGGYHNMQAHVRWGAGRSALHTRYLVMARSVYAAHVQEGQALGSALVRELSLMQYESSPEPVIDKYSVLNSIMLNETDITDAPWSQVVSNAAIIDYLSELITVRGWDLQAHLWDFANFTIFNVLTSVYISRNAWGCTKVAMLSRAVLRLYAVAARFVSGVAAESLRRQPSRHVAHLPHEWKDILAPDFDSTLFAMMVFILERSTSSTVTAMKVAVVDALIECTRHVQWECVPVQRRSVGGALDLALVAGTALGALWRGAHYCYQYLAYSVLQALLKPLVLEDANKLAVWSGEAGDDEADNPPPRFTLEYYTETFCALREVVEGALGHVRVCEETCALVEGEEAHRAALAFFLCGALLGEQCALARGDLTHHYVQIYREQKFAVPLLLSALRLLPAEVLSYAKGASGGGGASRSGAVQQRHVDMFLRMVPLHCYRYCGAAEVGAAACRVLELCVRGAGAGEARGWRGAAPHRHAAVLDALLQGYISPHVVKEEFTLVQQRAAELEDTDITVHMSSYEMTFILTVEDRPIELEVQLSRSHPLGLPKFKVAENSPTSNTGFLVMYMGYQNGSLLNALKLWVSAVTSKVERAPQCYICYCRLHPATGRLPQAYCRQCRNKFHTPCLRKWFATSNKSNCPLCRASF